MRACVEIALESLVSEIPYAGGTNKRCKGTRTKKSQRQRIVASKSAAFLRVGWKLFQDVLAQHAGKLDFHIHSTHKIVRKDTPEQEAAPGMTSSKTFAVRSPSCPPFLRKRRTFYSDIWRLSMLTCTQSCTGEDAKHVYIVASGEMQLITLGSEILATKGRGRNRRWTPRSLKSRRIGQRQRRTASSSKWTS